MGRKPSSRPQDATATPPCPLPSLSGPSRSNRTLCVFVSNCSMCVINLPLFVPSNHGFAFCFLSRRLTRILTLSHSLHGTCVLWRRRGTWLAEGSVLRVRARIDSTQPVPTGIQRPLERLPRDPGAPLPVKWEREASTSPLAFALRRV